MFKLGTLFFNYALHKIERTDACGIFLDKVSILNDHW